MESTSTNSTHFFIAEDLDDSITPEIIEKFFAENKINNVLAKNIEIRAEKEGEGKKFAKIYYSKNDLDITGLDDLEGKVISGDIKLKVRFTEDNNTNSTVKSYKYSDLKENDKIPYVMKYHEHVGSHFIQAPGDTTLKFIDQRTLDRQRGILKHFLTKLGTNLLSGSGIMNVSLPIRIFDSRSLLEVFAHQLKLAPYFLEKGGEVESPLEKLKYTTAYALTRIHLAVTQLKPFNPIWGETFQCKIGDTQVYMEQTSHHPPIYHFQHIGKNFKAWGYQEAYAATGANSVTAKTKGPYVIQYSDGTKHNIYPCTIVVGGTLMGDRTFSIVDKFYITDEKNDFISFIEFNPDERGTFSRLFTKNKNFPDYYKGCISRLSQCTFFTKDNSFVLNKNYTNFAEIKGEWSKNCYIDGELFWDYNDYPHYDLTRMSFTLPSDSTLREDLLLLKADDEEAAGVAKTKLEEIQRRDRKLRAEHSGESHH